jgi:hypothetical protein
MLWFFFCFFVCLLVLHFICLAIRILGNPLRHYWTNEKALETQSWPHWEKQDMANKLPGVNLQARDLIQVFPFNDVLYFMC